MVFFLGWELWEQLTFVLGCLIVIVFAIGFFKLWRSNQILRRYELLDEEKRERMAEMQRYGIDIPAINDIPFGSRAIQSGIEVDEIWISRPNTPIASQRASVATFMDDSSTEGTLQGRRNLSSTQDNSDNTSTKQRIGDVPGAGSSRVLKRSTLSEQYSSETQAPESGHLPQSQSDGFTNTRPGRSSDGPPQRRWSSIQNASEATTAALRASSGGTDPKTDPVAYGTAEVFVNTNTRRTVSGFEILPAGSLGDRVELHAQARHSEDHPSPSNGDGPRVPNKLHKPRPKR